MPAKDRTGQKYSKLTVLRRVSNYITPSGKKYARWLCHCECGNEVAVIGSKLGSGNTRSCGCLRSAVQTKHGMWKTPEYRSWDMMKTRCTNPNYDKSSYYLGRGITMCDSWKEFTSFYRDMGPKPTPQHTLERIDNDGNYEPSNCCWATRKQQARNTRVTPHLTYNGITKSLAGWAEEIGLSYNTLWNRIYRYHWSVDRALTEKKKGVTA